MARILITGANGQLGNSLRMLTGDHPGIEFVFTDVEELDITREEECVRVAQQEKPDFIVNCAAYTAVDNAESDPDTCFLLNAEAVKNLSDAAKSIDARIIHLSTDYVFSGRHFKPYTEEDLPDPDSVYGQSKLSGEELIREEKHAMIIRTSWLYSVYGRNFFKTMHRLTAGKQTLQVICDQTGTPTYAPDLAGAILEIIQASLKNPELYVPGIYHYSSEGVASWYDFAWEIGRMAGHGAEIIPVKTSDYPLPAPRPFYSVLNKTRIKEIYHIRIPHWKESLSVCLDAYNHEGHGKQ